MKQCDIRQQSDHKVVDGKQVIRFLTEFQPTVYTDTSTGNRAFGWTGQTIKGLIAQQTGYSTEPVARMLVTETGKYDVLQFNTDVMLPLMHLAIKALEHEVDGLKLLVNKMLLEQGTRINVAERNIDRLTEVMTGESAQQQTTPSADSPPQSIPPATATEEEQAKKPSPTDSKEASTASKPPEKPTSQRPTFRPSQTHGKGKPPVSSLKREAPAGGAQNAEKRQRKL